MAFIHFDYAFNSFMRQNKKRTEFKTSYCAGILVDANTVLTAARCIITQVYSSNERTYRKVEPNEFHQTIGSAYKLYFGIHDMTSVLNRNISGDEGAIEVQASDIHVVLFFFSELKILM